jgi:hypothetical protein
MNEFQGMNRYWMEDTYGKCGVALEGYGPYCSGTRTSTSSTTSPAPTT